MGHPLHGARRLNCHGPNISPTAVQVLLPGPLSPTILQPNSASTGSYRAIRGSYGDCMLYLLYGVLCYAAFLFTIAWSYGFVGDMVLPTTMDHGPALPTAQAFAIDMMLMMVFSLQHSMMARPMFKKVWTRVVPKTIERSTYVLAASVAMLALMKYWQPIPHVLWETQTPYLRGLLRTISLAGLTFTIYASFLINHFELFGVRQVWLHFKGVEYFTPRFASSWIYEYIRAPLMLGFLIAF